MITGQDLAEGRHLRRSSRPRFRESRRSPITMSHAPPRHRQGALYADRSPAVRYAGTGARCVEAVESISIPSMPCSKPRGDDPRWPQIYDDIPQNPASSISITVLRMRWARLPVKPRNVNAPANRLQPCHVASLSRRSAIAEYDAEGGWALDHAYGQAQGVFGMRAFWPKQVLGVGDRQAGASARGTCSAVRIG